MCNLALPQNYQNLVDYTSTDCLYRLLVNYREIESLAKGNCSSYLWDMYIDMKDIINKSSEPSYQEILNVIDSGDDVAIEGVARLLFDKTK